MVSEVEEEIKGKIDWRDEAENREKKNVRKISPWDGIGWRWKIPGPGRRSK